MMIRIKHCPGWAILTTGDEANMPYLDALAERAEMRSGWPWVSAEQWDEEFELIVREFWSRTAPGWLTRSTVEKAHSHYAVVHNASQAGAKLLAPEQTAALARLESTGAGETPVAVFGTAGERRVEMSLREAVIANLQIYRFRKALDVDHHDSFEGQWEMPRFNVVPDPVTAPTVAALILEGAL